MSAASKSPKSPKSSACTECIAKIQALKRQKNFSEAQRRLELIAQHVDPIMVSRGWRVGSLNEFFPRSKRLFGVNWNRGARISIRLRSPNDPEVLLPFDDCVGTMLHELTHMAIAPHNKDFYRLLDQLNDEYDTLLLSGKFAFKYGIGRKLGNGNRVLAGSAAERAQIIARAAERRKSAGHRLGGCSMSQAAEDGLSTRELVLQAALRRKEGAQSSLIGAPLDSTEIPRDIDVDSRTTVCQSLGSEINIIDPSMETFPTSSSLGSSDPQLTRSENHPLRQSMSRDQPPAPPKRRGRPVKRKPELIDEDEAPLMSHRKGKRQHSENQSTWTCPACTFLNNIQHLQCSMCSTERPIDSVYSTDGQYWICSTCGIANETFMSECPVCLKSQNSVAQTVDMI